MASTTFVVDLTELYGTKSINFPAQIYGGMFRQKSIYLYHRRRLQPYEKNRRRRRRHGGRRQWQEHRRRGNNKEDLHRPATVLIYSRYYWLQNPLAVSFCRCVTGLRVLSQDQLGLKIWFPITVP